MRVGGYTVQHTLSPDAASVVKQALGVAIRRGHTQVTPLHVASAMLATSETSLLRKACLQTHSHPLQCKALELCFNVALNRLPTSQSSPIMLNPNYSHQKTSLSNALVAAFKRAQAHQRRGSIENQQQPILALKVEIEQLIISILDDPSVSRVMREAGFSSTQIKNTIEQTVNSCQLKENIEPMSKDFSKSITKVQDGDVKSVIDTMMNSKRKNIVIIRDCLVSADAIVRGVIDKFERRNNVVFRDDLRFVQFVSLPLHSLNNLSREEVEDKVRELRCLGKSHEGRGVILYLGDLKWVSDYWSKYNEERFKSFNYSPMEDMIMELSKLMFGNGDNGKLWVMGIAKFETYMRCKTGHPSLEMLWDLLPLTLPVAGLDLTLNLESKDESRTEKKLLTCCGECSLNFTKEAQRIAVNDNSITPTTSSGLPSWLQRYKEENSMNSTNCQEHERVGNLCKKWNSICSSLHKQPHFLDKRFNLSSSSTSMSWPTLNQDHLNRTTNFESNEYPKEHKFFLSEIDGDHGGFDEPNLKTFPIPDLLSNPNSSPNSASCSEASEGDIDDDDDDEDDYNFHKIKNVNSDNIKILTNALEKRVPWLFFLGFDSHGKEKISRELARVVFGSKNNFITISLSSFSSTTNDDQENVISKKRARDEHGQSYLERFVEAVKENPHRVFFMEDVEHVDYRSQMCIKKAIEIQRITLEGGELVLLEDAIVVFSCERFGSVTKHCENGDDHVKRTQLSTFDLNVSNEDIGIFDSVDKQVIFKIQIL